MLNIKSSVVLKKIFLFIEEKRKLKIVTYNKKIQSILNIDIFDFKQFNRSYLVFYENGIGKEYDNYTGQLIFKGKYFPKEKKKIGLEFKEGKLVFLGEIRNGKKWEGEGKEYDNYGRLIYEGGFLNGKRHGKGHIIKYNEYNNKMFECECLNGINNGCAKEYNSQGEIHFIGEYLNGLRNGNGKLYFDGELIFDGEYLNGERNGKAKQYLPLKIKKEILIGEYLDGKIWNGKGYYSDVKNKILIKGEFSNGKITKGEEYYDIFQTFKGEYLDGKRWNGKGIEFDNDILIYEGEYLNGKRWKGREFINGQFIYINEDPNEEKNKVKGNEYFTKYEVIFKGEYLNGLKKKGKEFINRPEGQFQIYEGEYLDGKRWNGKGIEFIKDIVIYEGEYLNGKKKRGKEYKNDKLKYEYISEDDIYEILIHELIYEGEYLNGKRWNGKGKEFSEPFLYDEKNITFEGEYLNGKKWNGKGKEFDLKSMEKGFDWIQYEFEYINGQEVKEIEYNSPGNKIINKNENLKVIRGRQIEIYKHLILFEGVFFNGKKWDGNIFKYDNIGNMIFEGKLSKGEYIIKGKEYEGFNQ